MGVNAIRTAHNMPAVELMELADEMGVLIVSEAFDMWERSKTPLTTPDFIRIGGNKILPAGYAGIEIAPPCSCGVSEMKYTTPMPMNAAKS